MGLAPPQGMHIHSMRAACAAAAALALLVGAREATAARTPVTFEFFHASLSPHGAWHESETLGTVWRPRIESAGWHPYANGHWVYTDVGWTWVSNYEWGAIPYHYGTWALEPELGWVWVPGYVWGPAWVVFRRGPSYVGWAPVPPSYSIGTATGLDDYGPDHFVFVRAKDVLAPQIQRHAVPVERARAIFENTRLLASLRIEDDVVANRGLDPERVERVAKTRLERQSIERVPKVVPNGDASREALRVDAIRGQRGEVRVAAPERSDS
jgi:uncharacterized protein DUF6600